MAQKWWMMVDDSAKKSPAQTRISLRSQERLRIYQRFVGAGVLPSKVRQDLLAGEENHNHVWNWWWFRNPANSPVEGKVVYPHYLLKVLAPSIPGGWEWDFWLPSTESQHGRLLHPFLVFSD